MTKDQPGTLSRLRVLLLDDDPFTLDLLREMLDTLGFFETVGETDARKALGELTGLRPDVLVCDLSMPDMDGIEFLQAAAGVRYAGGVILLSGVDTGVRKAAERLARAQGLRVLGAFRKPIELADLHAALLPLMAAA